MPNPSPLQTSFAAGEIDPHLIGRTDLRAYGEGAAKLKNVWVRVSGGVSRRSGTRHVRELAGPGRLATLELDHGVTRHFVFTDRAVSILDDEAPVATLITPWTTAELPRLSWADLRGSLLVCHPAVPPQAVMLEPYGDWRVTPWTFDTAPSAIGDTDVRLQPYAKYTDPEATLEAAPDSGDLWAFTSNQRVFDPGHIGTRLRFKGTEIAITSVTIDRTTAIGRPLAPIDDASRTYDWEEQAFSPIAGYPAACLMFRERLVVGGVPAMANRLWMSKVGRPFNFDTGTGLDDEAISFTLGDNRTHAIQAFSAGRELEVFTTASEWTVDGRPLAPASTSAVKQTGIGCIATRSVLPVEVDGASAFVGRNGDSIIEYVFTDINTAYQAQDLAVRASHLLADPRDLAFDARRRILVVVNGNGRMATATLDRNAQMVAWSEQVTDGHVIAASASGAGLYLIVERLGTTRLEQLDDALMVDAGVVLTADPPQSIWSGLSHLEGAVVALVGDGEDLGKTTVSEGRVVLSKAVRELKVGLPYEHEVQPLPLLVDNRRRAELYRPLEISFRLHATGALDADIGEGMRTVALDAGESGFTGTKTLRARGWRRNGDAPLWRIAANRPLPFHLLSATSDVKVTR